MFKMSSRYAHLFLHGDDQYIFVDRLGTGNQGATQKVLHVQSGELRVRKVTYERLKIEGESSQEYGGSENAILTLLQESAHNRGARPNIVQFHGGADIPVSSQDSRSRQETYSKFYNGGIYLYGDSLVPFFILN